MCGLVQQSTHLFLPEGVLTLVTFKRFLARMRQDVGLQVALRAGRIITHITFVALLTLVGLPVKLEVVPDQQKWTTYSCNKERKKIINKQKTGCTCGKSLRMVRVFLTGQADIKNMNFEKKKYSIS
jgi:hypothetical protein